MTYRPETDDRTLISILPVGANGEQKFSAAVCDPYLGMVTQNPNYAVQLYAAEDDTAMQELALKYGLPCTTFNANVHEIIAAMSTIDKSSQYPRAVRDATPKLAPALFGALTKVIKDSRPGDILITNLLSTTFMHPLISELLDRDVALFTIDPYQQGDIRPGVRFYGTDLFPTPGPLVTKPIYGLAGKLMTEFLERTAFRECIRLGILPKGTKPNRKFHSSNADATFYFNRLGLEFKKVNKKQNIIIGPSLVFQPEEVSHHETEILNYLRNNRPSFLSILTLGSMTATKPENIERFADMLETAAQAFPDTFFVNIAPFSADRYQNTYRIPNLRYVDELINLVRPISDAAQLPWIKGVFSANHSGRGIGTLMKRMGVTSAGMTFIPEQVSNSKDFGIPYQPFNKLNKEKFVNLINDLRERSVQDRQDFTSQAQIGLTEMSQATKKAAAALFAETQNYRALTCKK